VPPRGEAPDVIVQTAEQGLRQAKSQGGNRIALAP
jgi:hypothetical protein